MFDQNSRLLDFEVFVVDEGDELVAASPGADVLAADEPPGWRDKKGQWKSQKIGKPLERADAKPGARVRHTITGEVGTILDGDYPNQAEWTVQVDWTKDDGLKKIMLEPGRLLVMEKPAPKLGKGWKTGDERINDAVKAIPGRVRERMADAGFKIHSKDREDLQDMPGERNPADGLYYADAPEEKGYPNRNAFVATDTTDWLELMRERVNPETSEADADAYVKFAAVHESGHAFDHLMSEDPEAPMFLEPPKIETGLPPDLEKLLQMAPPENPKARLSNTDEWAEVGGVIGDREGFANTFAAANGLRDPSGVRPVDQVQVDWMKAIIDREAAK